MGGTHLSDYRASLVPSLSSTLHHVMNTYLPRRVPWKSSGGRRRGGRVKGRELASILRLDGLDQTLELFNLQRKGGKIVSQAICARCDPSSGRVEPERKSWQIGQT